MNSGLTVLGRGVVATRLVRLLGPRAYRTAPMRQADLTDFGTDDIVVLAGAGPHAMAATVLSRQGASVVSVSDDLDDISELLALDTAFADRGSTLVVGAAMAPGLSGLLARHLHHQRDDVDEIHVAFHATAGPACARQHHRALAGRAAGWHDHEWIERPGGSGRELCWFPEPVGARDCYRAHVADPVLLHHDFPTASRITARMSATRRDRLTARLPMLRRPHAEGGIGAVRVEVRGAGAHGERRTLIVGIAEFVGAAAAATAHAMVGAIERGDAPSGAVATSHPDLDHRRLLGDVVASGVRLQEFTGVVQPV